MRTGSTWITVFCLLAVGLPRSARADASRVQRGQNSAGSGNVAPHPRGPRLMSRKKYKRLRSRLPEVADPVLQKILRDDRLILYTDVEMPRAYQDWDGGLPGVHSPHYNISANSSEPYGNANIEFPWGTPAGTHRAKNVASFKFLWLPRGADGNVLPVVWYRWRHPGDSARGYEWIFPVGAIVGEVLCLRGPDGKQYTFELRIRVRDYGEWAVDVFRPFPTATALADCIKQVRPQWRADAKLSKLVTHLEQPMVMKKHRLADDHPRHAFVESMGIDRLPPVGDDQLVIELLAGTKFQSALDVVWRDGASGSFTCAPTTSAAFHIVPAGYDAGFVEVDPVSCSRCHDTVGQHAQYFEYGRDWYGRVRGSDAIFSFHPFSPLSVSPNGIGQSVSMRRELIESGVLERYNRSKHPHDKYQRLE